MLNLSMAWPTQRLFVLGSVCFVPSVCELPNLSFACVEVRPVPDAVLNDDIDCVIKLQVVGVLIQDISRAFEKVFDVAVVHPDRVK